MKKEDRLITEEEA